MTNDEIRMTNEAPMTNDEAARGGRSRLVIGHWDLVIRSTFWLRHSSF